LESNVPPVLILGCGRSGTSIFGELFEGLGPYTYFSEPNFAQLLAQIGPAIAAKVPTEDEAYGADPGLSFPLDALFQVAPQTKVYWIVRHPFDAICSLRIGIGNGWRHHPRPPDWEAWLDEPLLAQCAHHWNYINSHGYDAVREMATVVRFEDMIADPALFATKIVAQIGLPSTDVDESVSTWAGRVQNTNNSQFVEAKTSRTHSRPDHSVRVNRWQENLTSAEAETLAALVGGVNQRYGYDLSR